MRLTRPLVLVGALLLAVGCRSIGPGSVTRDRYDYSAALAESWKRQMLLNLVKTRYLDLPIFLDVGQIVSGYTLERSASVGVNLAETDGLGGNATSLGGALRFTDRPTITYMPLTGDRFLESFLTPIDPAKVFALMQAGYAADFVLELSLDSLNGLRNHPALIGAKRKADPEFFRVLALLREIQDAGAVGMRVERPTNGNPASVFFFRDDRADATVLAQSQEARRLLGVPLEESSFRLVQSPVRGRPGELSVDTRSLLQLLSALALGVEVPAVHQNLKLTPPTSELAPGERNLLRVQSGDQKPPEAFAAVTYEGQWFWIASDDWKSKRTFTSILFLFSLANATGAQNLPTLTIPTQ